MIPRPTHRNHSSGTGVEPFLSIAENIFIGNEQAKGGVIDWDKTRAEAKKLLDRVGLPEDPDTKVMDIGVGKQQLVEIAKALSKDVKLLILMSRPLH